MKRLKSDIPAGAIELVISEYRKEGNCTYFRLTECVWQGSVVGQRAYNQHGQLVIETPLKNGKKHGREYSWDEENGKLLLIEPYCEGQLHGTAKQYGENGKVIGKYKLLHGTGFDIWRAEDDNGMIFISEIHSLQDGLPHGYEWWLNRDQHSIHQELHWYKGEKHGIERAWNSAGKLQRGYPQYWLKDRMESVTKREYLKVTQSDKTLPIFQLEENLPERKFPTPIERLILPML